MQQSMRTQAFGSEFSLASPHYLSTYFGFNEYLKCADPIMSSLATLFSLFINQPHLCGIGGDLVSLIRLPTGEVECFNGTGKTGSKHSFHKYTSSSQSIPLRGWDSSMVYGAPYSINEIINRFKLDLSGLTKNIIIDSNKGVINTPSWIRFLKKHSNSFKSFNINNSFLNTLHEYRIGDVSNTKTGDLILKLCEDGFESLYHGTLGKNIANAAAKKSDVYLNEDFINFRPEKSEVFKLNFRNFSISMYGNNGPWIELSVLLNHINSLVEKANSAPKFEEICSKITNIIGKIDVLVEDFGGRNINRSNFEKKQLISKICTIIDDYEDDHILPASGKGGDTIFLAAAHKSGIIIGITSSIFTPFGSLVDPIDNGLILSNRAYSFNLNPESWKCLKPNSIAPHTINTLIIEDEEKVFTLGVTGGPVQSQVLAQLVYRILYLGDDIQLALERPRAANVGFTSNQDAALILCEPDLNISNSKKLNRLSESLGISQVAGFFKKNRACFSASDPRGEGISLAI